MTTRNYSAHYRCTRCGHARSMNVTASDYHNALTKLPRWIWPDSHQMRREGGITPDDWKTK